MTGYPNDPTESLTSEVSRGGVLLFGLNAAQLVAGIVAHLAVAWFLTPREFGVFAIATGSASLILAMKDGGVRLFLARLNPLEIVRYRGDAFWVGLTSSVVMGSLMVAFSPLVSAIFDERDVIPVLITMAWSLPAGAPAQIAFAHLQAELRFGAIAGIQTASAMVRYLTMVVLAALDFGPLALSLPMIAAGLFDSVAATVAAHIRPWQERFSIQGLVSMLRRTGWVIVGTVFTAVYLQVDYFTLGLLVPVDVLGLYYFSYQLVHRMTGPFVATIRTVLLPAFARAKQGDQSATLGISFLTLVSGPVFVWLAVAFEPIEDVLWNGRWADATGPLVVLCAVYPLLVASALLHTMLQAHDKFRLNAYLVAYRTVGLVVASVIAGTISPTDDVTVIAVVIAAYLFVSLLADGVIVARATGVDVLAAGRAVLAPYLFALAAGAAAFLVGEAVELSPKAQLVIITSTLAFLVLAGWRWLFPRRIDDLAAVLRNVPGGSLVLRLTVGGGPAIAPVE